TSGCQYHFADPPRHEIPVLLSTLLDQQSSCGPASPELGHARHRIDAVMAKMSPMSWMLARARTGARSHPPGLAGQPIKEFEVWMSVEDRQREVETERPSAPRHVQQCLAERRTFGDFCTGPRESAHVSHAPRAPLSPAATSADSPTKHLASKLSASRSPRHLHESSSRPLNEFSPRGRRSRAPARSSSRRIDSYHPRSRSPLLDQRVRRAYHSRSPARRDWSRRQDRDPSSLTSARPPLSWESRAEHTHASWLSLAAQAIRFLDQISNAPAGAGVSSPHATQPAGLAESARAAITPRPHIDGRSGKPHPALKFTSEDAYSRMYGVHGESLDEVKQFFPGIVVRLEKPPKSPGALVTFSTAILWLEVKGSSDPKDNGVCWQIDACRSGFEEYRKPDSQATQLPDIRDFYYAHRQLFHRPRSSTGRYLQTAPRPRDPTAARGQLEGRARPRDTVPAGAGGGGHSRRRRRGDCGSVSGLLGDKTAGLQREALAADVISYMVGVVKTSGICALPSIIIRDPAGSRGLTYLSIRV
ncbi:hypothetical protein JHW43_001055, partial [Diplocarpon mali]